MDTNGYDHARDLPSEVSKTSRIVGATNDVMRLVLDELLDQKFTNAGNGRIKFSIGKPVPAAAAAKWLRLYRQLGDHRRRDEHQQFMDEEYVPAWNAFWDEFAIRMCLRCWGFFVRWDRRARGRNYCSPACASVLRNRGIQKVDGGKSPEERARMRGKKETARHLKSHKNCPAKRGKQCDRLEAILRGQMAIEESPQRLEQYRHEQQDD